MKPKNAWSPPSHCPECDTSLHPIGNTNYGLSKGAQRIREASIIYFVISFTIVLLVARIITIPYFDFRSPAKTFFAALVGIPTIPTIWGLAISCMLPKVTHLHCHHCGYNTSYRKNRPTGLVHNPGAEMKPKVDTSVPPKKFKSTLSRNDSIKLK